MSGHKEAGDQLKTGASIEFVRNDVLMRRSHYPSSQSPIILIASPYSNDQLFLLVPWIKRIEGIKIRNTHIGTRKSEPAPVAGTRRYIKCNAIPLHHHPISILSPPPERCGSYLILSNLPIYSNSAVCIGVVYSIAAIATKLHAVLILDVAYKVLIAVRHANIAREGFNALRADNHSFSRTSSIVAVIC
jgi:hypothetical protein